MIKCELEGEGRDAFMVVDGERAHGLPWAGESEVEDQVNKDNGEGLDTPVGGEIVALENGYPVLQGATSITGG